MQHVSYLWHLSLLEFCGLPHARIKNRFVWRKHIKIIVKKDSLTFARVRGVMAEGQIGQALDDGGIEGPMTRPPPSMPGHGPTGVGGDGGGGALWR